MADLAEQGHVPLRAPDRTVDLIVIGAGPAGMAAAVEARRHGMSVLLLDEQETPGGQIYRRVTQADEDRRRILGPDYARGSDLAREFTVSGAEYWPRTAVWQVTRERRVHALRDGRVAALEARAIVLATGAMERPFPIPGWTLSGVMTAGAAQILMKSAGIVPGQAPVLAGCGPLLYLLAWQYLRAGVRIGAILDTAAPADLRAALRHASGALAGWPDLVKGLKLLSGIKRHRVPHYKGVTGLAIQGEDGCAQRIQFQADGRTRTLPASLVLLHQGVVPNTQITWSLRAGHVWDDAQLCWRPVVDGWGELDVPGIYVAGDGAAIAGARAAEIQGRLTGLGAAAAAGRLTAAQRDARAAPLVRERQSFLRIRPFLDRLYRPKDENRIPADEVMVCRCEEVTAGRLRDDVRLGCVGPNQVKSFSRCGMGPCQGRQCGLTVTELIAGTRQVPPADAGYYRIRPPIKPITLAQLAKEAEVNE